jgi:hypothetical protein
MNKIKNVIIPLIIMIYTILIGTYVKNSIFYIFYLFLRKIDEKL